MAQEGLITTLAEPNLTALNGQTASFLAGGEFPIPIGVQPPSGSSGSTQITIEFKTFGVSLDFTPTILDANHLNLKIRPEVSELSQNGAVQISGFTIPALTVRRAETTVELGSGQSFALAGLLQNSTEQDISKVPWLGDVPILGALFRSDQFLHNESELVIIVTPYLVKPSNVALAAPTDGYVSPHDVQRVINSETYRQGLPSPPRGPVEPGNQVLWPHRPGWVQVGLREGMMRMRPTLIAASLLLATLAACNSPVSDYTSSEAVNRADAQRCVAQLWSCASPPAPIGSPPARRPGSGVHGRHRHDHRERPPFCIALMPLRWRRAAS